MKKRSLLLLVMMTLALSACNTPKAAPKTDVTVQTAVAELLAQTAAASASQAAAEVQPSATVETPIAETSTQIVFDNGIVQPGDLPAGIAALEITTTVEDRFIQFPPAVKTIRQEFLRELDQKKVGGVSMFQYSNTADAEQALNIIHGMIGENSRPISEIGETSMLVYASNPILDYYFTKGDIAFTRCNTTAYVRLEYRTEAYDETGVELINFAKKLDERMKSVLCGN